jgi:hypothetical protein
MTDLLDAPLVGSQDPTFEWCPEYAISYGDEAVALYNAAAAPMGQLLDDWQRAALRMAFAVDPRGVLVCFELAIILSRQNGKGEVLIALELAWLFLFNEPLIIHSAHLFTTAREHFLKMLVIIQTNPDLDRRIGKIREGKGDEEIILKTGGRLKFMTRKGGAGLGFTGSKLVTDEAMHLDAVQMGVGLPTMATKRNAQVVYTGSAGGKDSTQLAEVRRRGLDRDPAVGIMMWEAARPVYDERGQLVDGDDPEDPRTWAKTNPTLGDPPHGRISPGFVRHEARVLGGMRSETWWRQRLGVGDYPVREAAWKVISKEVWEARCDEASSMLAGGRALAVDGDNETGVYTLGFAGRRGDKVGHVELIHRQRGGGWVIDRIEHLRTKPGGRRYPVVILKSSIAGHLIEPLQNMRYRVHVPSQADYASGCQGLVTDLGSGKVMHIGQQAMTTAAGHGDQRKGVEGGWVWDRDQPHQSAIIVPTLAWWAVSTGRVVTASRVY